ncbi:hypothetical protein [Oleiagrimonas sp. C23AA]|uniref:hypothetical protein n=1 Tax=Oleiagrimonas sp. C23AA TaxID=2719047 RepID=UPI00142395FD|nr:hypothetical protein [Oleiagrimonas sp. C23AA]NII10702.1 hypothetical protein [Oleiagrimonas sp. C23AA]
MNLLALACIVLAVTALYLGSSHQRLLRTPRPAWRWLALPLALLGAMAWIQAHGLAAGIAGLLCAAMLAAVGLPYLGWARTPATAPRSRR